MLRGGKQPNSVTFSMVTKGRAMSTTSHYQVTGMTCGRCVDHVKEEIRELRGVHEVELTVAGDMTIVSDSELAFEDVAAAVAEAGDYTVGAVD